MAKKNHRHYMVALTLLTAPWAASACNTEPYIGTICTFSMDWCPSGYVPADGRSLTIRENTALFGLIGFTYGGDNSTVFNIPDLRGRFPIGKGQGTNLPVTINLAQKVGQQALTLAPAQVPVQSHIHPAIFTGTGGGSVTVPATPGNLAITAALPVTTAVAGTATLAAGQNYLASMTATAGTNTVKFTGPYTTTAPSVPAAATMPATVTTTGTGGTPQFTVPSGITGGTVTVNANTVVPATQAVSTQSPAIGMSVCIATVGLYPNRP